MICYANYHHSADGYCKVLIAPFVVLLAKLCRLAPSG